MTIGATTSLPGGLPFIVPAPGVSSPRYVPISPSSRGPVAVYDDHQHAFDLHVLNTCRRVLPDHAIVWLGIGQLPNPNSAGYSFEVHVDDPDPATSESPLSGSKITIDPKSSAGAPCVRILLEYREHVFITDRPLDGIVLSPMRPNTYPNWAPEIASALRRNGDVRGFLPTASAWEEVGRARVAAALELRYTDPAMAELCENKAKLKMRLRRLSRYIPELVVARDIPVWPLPPDPTAKQRERKIQEYLRKIDRLQSKTHRPCILKASSAANMCVVKVDRRWHESVQRRCIERHLDESAAAGVDDSAALVEELLPGQEVGGQGLECRGQFHTDVVLKVPTPSPFFSKELQYYADSADPRYLRAQASVRRMDDEIARRLNLKGPYNFDNMVLPDGKVSILDVNTRAGPYLPMLDAMCEHDVTAMYVRASMGEDVRTEMAGLAARQAVFQTAMLAEGGTIGRAVPEEAIRAVAGLPGLYYFSWEPFQTAGSIPELSSWMSSRHPSLGFAGRNIREARSRVKRADRLLREACDFEPASRAAIGARGDVTTTAPFEDHAGWNEQALRTLRSRRRSPLAGS